MEKFVEVLAVVAPVIAALLLGFLARKKGMVNKAAIDGIKALVMNITLPAVLIGAFYTAQVDRNFLAVVLTVVLACFAGLAAGTLLRKALPGSEEMLPFLTTGFEAGMMGYGLYAMLFPPEALRYFATVDLGQVLFVFTVYMALLNLKQGKGVGATIRGMFLSPTLLAILAGLLLAVTGLGTQLQQSAGGAVFDALQQYLSAPTGMLMLFVVGSSIELEGKSLKKGLITVALRTVIMAVLCGASLWILSRFMAMPPQLTWAIVLLFTLPAPFVLPIFSKDPKQAAYLSSTLSLGSLLSILAFTVISILV